MRYLPHTDADVARMLGVIGVESIDDLFAQIPPALRVQGPLELPPALDEASLLGHLDALGERNQRLGSQAAFLGGGWSRHRVPVTVDHAFIPEWVEAHLTPLPRGRATVLFHSFAWQYLTPDDAGRTQRALDVAAAAATPEAPFARLSLEAPGRGDYAHTELRLTLWPRGQQRLLATASAHPPPVHWHAT